MANALTVWWDGNIVGSLVVDRYGDTTFAYSEDWLTSPHARAISQSLPLRREPFSRRQSRPFFEGLLPEENQRIAVARALGLSPENEFRLLEKLGGEIAGALSLWPEGQDPPQTGASEADARPLSDSDLIAILDQLPTRPMLAGREGLRLSLAGAQTKLPIVVTDAGIALPTPGQPTTHILKPAIERFPGTVENEAFAMRLARDIGLSVANTALRSINGRPVLLVERYDRVRNADGTVKRLHQEDFCQALGVPSSRKYAADGGPTFRDCFTLLRSSATRPAREVLKLFDTAVFNLIIGNADAHGKNYSLIYRETGIEMAPLYDLLSTVVYPELSTNLAMKVARRATLEELQSRDWKRFAEETGLTEPYIRRRARALAEEVQAKADGIRLSEDCAELVKGRATQLLRLLD